MPVRYYAVRIGREGPKIYSNYCDFRSATLGLSGASGKGFDTLEEAEGWLRGVPTGTSGASVTRTTITLDVRFEDHHSALTSTSTTVSIECARHYPEPQPGYRRIEDQSPLNMLQNLKSPRRFPHSQQLRFLKSSNEFFDWLKVVKIFFSQVRPEPGNQFF
ncbi:hypothetical protein DEU56DRAFT_47513 [Suillus clintonianus]|uniref:uncharacterized protein n=1 Tax=Suillus clintonianus TaxID=1904413 RepID=UPI001B880A27|nr:uncharacterized protein DEU56DRAFT_47513 [Suillus clintonianus]KAG2123603.1 hypothetical protein DEU56DRAFT_47513 [Suillus clintonianus]